MKRPPGLWILLSAGVLWLSLQDVYGIRATALIFGKSTTSTTTEAPSSEAVEAKSEETASSTEPVSSNNTANETSTARVLTGIPQIDYIWDPNLPQELNGYNLSEYPFYERVPVNIDKEIDFKCDGLHDGFYASIPHKCQVYHHCLYGTRYDFLCANYTAFDQKTFICHFVSEVDCVNSKNFWHRNDALYQAASTTTQAPLKLNIYTTAPPEVGDPITPRRPIGGGARRPYRPRRRRPQVEYYDDEYYDEEYYDERPRATRGRKRPRPRPRPVYDDEEEDYEEERYESRRGGGRRRPYRKRNKDRRKSEYDEDEDEQVEERFEDEDFIAARKRQKTEDKRKPATDDEEEERDQRRPGGKRRPSSEKREQDEDSDRKPPRKSSSNRKPAYDEYEDELPQSDDSRHFEQRPRKKFKGNKEESPDGRPIIKPATGTIYDRPRVAPRINLPVPKNAADKFAYKAVGSSKTTSSTKAPPPIEEEEYLDEDYEEPLPKRPKNRNRRPQNEGKRETNKNEDSKEQASEARHRPRKPVEVEEIVEKTTTAKPKYSSGRNRYPRPTAAPKKKPVIEEYYDEDEYLDDEKEVEEKRPPLKLERKPSTTSTTTTTTTTTTTPAPPKKEKEPIMRVIKRPFLPSRGGSPYSSRGLQPVGLKALDKSEEESYSKPTSDRGKVKHPIDDEEEDYYEEDRSRERLEEKPVREQEDVQSNRRPQFKPSPVLIKVPIRSKYNSPSAEGQELIDSEPSRQQSYKTRDFPNSRANPKPKIIERDPLDLNEYDVTINDALNPTLPNLPVRSFPTGFSTANDYSYSTYTRPRYTSLEPNNYVHPNKVVRSQQRYEGVPQNQYSTIGAGYRQQPQQQTQAIYSSY